MEDFATFLHGVEGSQQPRPVVDTTGLKGQRGTSISTGPGTLLRPVPSAGRLPTPSISNWARSSSSSQRRFRSSRSIALTKFRRQTHPISRPDCRRLHPREFEVAVVRPSDPKEKHFGIAVDASGKINIQHASVETLIAYAWDIDRLTILRGSNVIDQDFYDVTGKAATDASPGGPGSRPPVDPNDMREMLRSLLAERFHLKVHAVDHPFDAYNLSASSGPRMKKAGPSSRTYCKAGLEPG